MPLPVARLHTIYTYDCESCGRENLVRPCVADLPAEDMQEARSLLGIEPWEEGDVITMPDEVTCKFCGTVFATMSDRMEEGN